MSVPWGPLFHNLFLAGLKNCIKQNSRKWPLCVEEHIPSFSQTKYQPSCAAEGLLDDNVWWSVFYKSPCTWIVTMCTFVLMCEICSQSVDKTRCSTFAGRWPLSAEQPGSRSRLNTARRLMDVTIHYMHHSLNTALPLPCTPFCPHLHGYGLQHVITVICSLWRHPHQSSLRPDEELKEKCFVSPRECWERPCVWLCPRIISVQWCCGLVPQKVDVLMQVHCFMIPGVISVFTQVIICTVC